VSSGERVLTRRPLRADSAATRQRIIDAGIGLARTGSIDGVTMRDIARAADVSTATAYTYFASKEHVYAEAYLDGLHQLTNRLRERPPRGATAADRVASVFRRALQGAAESGGVVQAMALALASSDPSVAPLRPDAVEVFDEWMAIAIGDAQVVDRARALKVLQLTMFASFVAIAHGQITLEESRSLLDLTVRRLVVEPNRVTT
jgi:AcrR family transcriptional regulator